MGSFIWYLPEDAGRTSPLTFARWNFFCEGVFTKGEISLLLESLVSRQDLRSPESLASVHLTLTETEKRFPDGLPLLDPIEDMNVLVSQVPFISHVTDRGSHVLQNHSTNRGIGGQTFQEQRIPHRGSEGHL